MEIKLMDIKSIIKENLFFSILHNKNKNLVFKELINVLSNNNRLINQDLAYQDILDRESLSTTFMENLVAIPHCKSSNIKQLSICVGVSNEYISNELDDNKKAKIFFMIVVPQEQSELHLDILSYLAQYISDQDFCKELLNINSKEELIILFEKYNVEDNLLKNSIEQAYDIVAITACPVGIAHTYLVAEKLEKIAKIKNLKIKVQTNGSIGVRNELSKEDISNAKAVILAVDVDIDDSMFHNKYVMKVPISLAMNKTESLIDDALQNKKKYVSKNFQSNSTSEVSSGIFNFYKHLLNGVSFMIPFVVVGGVLIALAIAFSGIQINTGVSINNPILKSMEKLGAISFSFMVPILAGYIAFSISGKPALAPAMIGGILANEMKAGFLGGIIIGFLAGYFVKWLVSFNFPKILDTIMPVLIIPLLGALFVAIIMYFIGSYIFFIMDLLTNGLKNMQSSGSIILSALLGLMIAFDMGGPINKVAFLFGVSMIASGVPTIMGPIAAAICIPPLGMALATFLNPKKYTNEEKQAGKASFLMGLIGITEGAIPFAASDPLRVIPAICLGSAVSAGLCGFFKVADYAPHGGLIVLPVIDGKIAFIFSIIIGCLVCAFCVNLLKSNKSM